MPRIYQYIIAGLLLVSNGVMAQFIRIDRGIRVNNLWCFPLVNDSLTYVFLPSSAMLPLNADRKPEFSMIRYVKNTATSSADKSITEAEGGAVLHFLMQYDTPEEEVKKANAQLRKIVDVEGVHIKGPYIFESGRYALVSSVLQNSADKAKYEVMAMGEAPVLEGTKLALSFELTPQQSKLMMESFKMKTSDLSIVFDLGFAGIGDAFNATLKVKWSDVYNYYNVKGSVKVYVVGADIQKEVENLRKENAVELKIEGDDAATEALINRVYDKVIELLFEPIENKESQEAKMGMANMMGDVATAMASSAKSAVPFGLTAGLKLRDIKREGNSVMNFNKAETVKRHHFITFNLGDLYAKYGNDPEMFRTVNMDDVDFQQREIAIGIDGNLAPEFQNMIDGVTVTLKKEHVSSEPTLRELVIHKNTIASALNEKMVYGSFGDTDREKWLNYSYRTSWQFRGGKSYESPWKTQSAAMINLYSPFHRMSVELVGDLEAMKSKNIRATVIALEYDFFGEHRRDQITVKTSDKELDKKFEITLPLNQFEYSYSLTHYMLDGTQKTFQAKSKSGVIFIDDIPN